MIKTTFKCDLCGATVERGDLFSVGVGFAGATVDPFASSHGPRADWCRSCMFTVGLIPRWTKPDHKREESPNPMTLEALVREIAREMAARVERLRG